jgi:hypothetical protein
MTTINPLPFVVKDFVDKRIAQIEKRCKFPLRTQKRMLRYLINQGVATRFGKAHSFEKIATIEDFQKNVPIAQYEDFKSDILEMMHGAPDILWPGTVRFFAKSSATTAESKYIPVTQASLTKCHYRGGKDMLAYYIHTCGKTTFLSGKILSLCGTLSPFAENKRAKVGDISAILTKKLPPMFRMFRFPGHALALEDGWEQKIEKISTLAIDQNITGFLGAPMWVSAFIKKTIEKSGKKSIFDVWPKLEVFMHGGISFKPYRSVFNELVKSENMHYIEGYNASEGYFAIQDDPSRLDEMLLMLDYGVFYEFITLADYQNENYTALPIDKVVLGVQYVIVISTPSGLWRYILGDTVKFTTLFPHRIKITGRTKQYLNTYDEELTVDNAEEALAYATHVTGATVHTFSMSATNPDKAGRGRHEWVIGFTKKPEDMANFTDALDRKLSEINNDYKSRRAHDIVLFPPIIHTIAPELFDNWMKSHGKVGAQCKVPRISNSREHIESILSFSKEHSSLV